MAKLGKSVRNTEADCRVCKTRTDTEPLSKNRAEHCAHLIGHTGHQWRVANVAHVIWPASIVQKPHHVNPGPSINSDQDYIMIT